MTRFLFVAGISLLLAITTGCPDQEPRVAVNERAEGFSRLVQDVLPTIVFIQTEIEPPPELEQLPGVPELPDEPVLLGVGSGVIYEEDGYILTNNHVVRNADRVLVVLHDRRYFEAEVVGRDPSTEIAVVRIEGQRLPTARLGDSDQLEIGDWVLAMGSPLGLQFSVTSGIVSGKGRALGIIERELEAGAPAATPLEHFIQTDAALSPGNSGGPLVNAAGEVIGINTAIAAPPGVPASFGFAIPSNIARRVADQLIRHGEVRRPFLGVLLTNVSPSMARTHGLTTVEGAAVAEVQPGGPADRAGLRPGDIVLAVADRSIITVSDLQAELLELEPGTTIKLSVLRRDRELKISVELGEMRGGVKPEDAAP